MAHRTLSRPDPHPGTSPPKTPDLTHKIAIFWTTSAPDRYPERSKMAPYHHPTCVTSVWVRLMPKVSKTVVVTTKRVTKVAKNWRKIAIIWQFLSHMGYLMAPKLIWHEYLVAPMIWCDFEHFRVSGSIPTWQLLCSFTEAIRVASPFDQNSQKFWFFFVLRFFILRFFILRSYIEYVDSVSTVATEM